MKYEEQTVLGVRQTLPNLMLCLVVSSLLIINGCSSKTLVKQPEVKDGTIDLSDWQFKQNRPVKLKGMWHFAWKEFVQPAPIDEIAKNYPDLIKVPSFWSNQKNPQNPDNNYSGQGHGTYLLTIQLGTQKYEGDNEIALKFSGSMAAAQIMIFDDTGQKQLANISMIKPSATKAEEIPLDMPKIVRLKDFTSQKIMVMIRVSNHQFPRGGLYRDVMIGDLKTLEQNQLSDLLTSLFLAGALVIISIYHFILYTQRRKDKTTLAFCLFCGIMSVRELVLARFFEFIDIGHSLVGYNTLISTSFATIPLMILGNGVFIYYMFPGKLYQKLYKYLMVPLGLSLVALAAITKPAFFGNYSIFFTIFIAVGSSIGFAYVIYLAVKKDNIARWMTVGLLLIIAGATNDVLHMQQVIETGLYAPYAFLGFVLLQSAIISGKSAFAFKQTEILSVDLQKKNDEITFFNQNLEKLIDDKTREIKGLLDHIPQGVMTIEAEGLIGKNFSAHLSEVLCHDKVANLTFKEVILERSSLSADDQDQAWQSIINSVSYDELGFILNSDKFPIEIEYTYEKTTKILAATWNPQVKDEVIETILVTLLDVTAEKKLEAEARKQQKEMAKITELVAVPEAKAHGFFTTSANLLEEIKVALGAGAESIDDDRVKMLFVNAHTVKGSARTLALSELTEAIHLMEQRYSQILRKEEEVNIDVMNEDFNLVISVFDSYYNVNRDSLNRNTESNFINIDRNIVEKTFYLMKDFVTGGEKVATELLPVFDNQSSILARLIFENLPQVFDDYRERVIKIAADTGREEPVLDFTIADTIISADQKEVLDMAMIHLLRNAMDHGIEAKEDRIEKGKPGHGTLTINVETDNDILMMTIQDDGKGLPIDILREKGLKNGQLTENSSLQDISQLIFSSGVSTAAAVTQISGRGVGMDAVRQFMEKSGGSVTITVEDEKPQKGFYNFYFKITLPLSQIILDRSEEEQGDDGAAA
ncbi:MAG: hypothetical protein CMP10_17715 [Zetaproteobacteria bacterium]|nr:hypothetical protein [Pseudobdellovibrionaceae bacterium]